MDTVEDVDSVRNNTVYIVCSDAWTECARLLKFAMISLYMYT